MPINILESARLAIKTLIANKLRAFLTMVGISIGVGAVIALMAIGVGVQRYIADQFTSAGTNLVGVTPGRVQRGGPPGGFGNQTVLTVNDYKAIAGTVPYLENTSAEFSAIGDFVYEGATTQVQVNGALPAFAELRNWPAVQGPVY